MDAPTVSDALPYRSPIDGSRFAERAPGDMLGYEPRPLTSGKHSHDMFPWRNRYDDSRWVDNWSNWDGLIYDPRPEYDNHNRFLIEFRAGMNTGTSPARARSWLHYWGTKALLMTGEHMPASHLEHAERVLRKLAALPTTTTDAQEN